MHLITIIATAVFLAAGGFAAEAPAAAEGGDDAPVSPDLSGYRLCPKCHTLNPGVAAYCMRCGASLDDSTGPAWRSEAATVRRVVLAPMVSAGTPYYLGPRAQARFDWGRLAYEPAYAYYPLDGLENRYDGDTEPHYLENLLRIYVGDARLRPFAAVDLRLLYRYGRLPYHRFRHYVELTPTAGGGVNVHYDGRGSFLEAAAAFGGTVFWTAGDDDPDGRASFAGGIENVTFVNENLGIWARGAVVVSSREYYYYADAVFILAVGPAFSW